MRRPALQKPLSMDWPRRAAWSLYALVLWEILLRAENPDLAADDSGEMIAGSFALGLPHPPGYPLFDLAGRLFSRLPLGSPALRYNLLSAFFVWGALLLTAGTVLYLAEKKGPALKSYPGWWAPGLAMGAGFVLLTNHNLFAQALSAKGAVYTLTLLLVSFLAAWRIRQDRQALTQKQGILLLFLTALGLANHWQTVLLFIPFLTYWFWTSRWALSIKRAAFALTALIMGISPYLYLPLRANLHPLPCWGNPVSPAGFLWVVSRKLVQGSESFFPGFVFWVHSFSRLLENIFWETLPGFGILALAGLFFIFKYRTQWGSALILLYAPLLTAVSLVQESQDIGFLKNVFLVSVSGLWVLFGFWGLLILMERFQKPKNSWILSGFGILALMGLVLWGQRVFEAQDKSHYTLADDFGKNALRQIPRGGLLVAGGDPYVMPVFYDQFVLRLRPDLLFTPDIFLVHDWGWEQIARQRPDWGNGWRDEKTLGGRWARLLEWPSGQGVFYALGPRYLEPVLSTVPGTWTPQGLAERWTSKGMMPLFDPARLRREMDGERLRGLGAGRVGEWDFSSYQILRYYGDQYFQAALESGRRSLMDDRLVFLNESLSLFPGNAAACNDLAGLLQSRGYWEMALVVLGDGLRSEPGFQAGWRNRALLEAKEGLTEGALADERRLLSLGWDGPLPSLDAASEGKGTKSAKVYGLLSRRYESQGLLFLAEKALETSRRLSEDPKGDSL